MKIWQREIKHVLIATAIIFILEVLLSKEQNYFYIFFSILWKVILISLVRFIFITLKKPKI